MDLMTRKGNQKSFNCVTYNYADLFHICHVITISLLRLLGRCYFGDAENVEKKHTHKKKTDLGVLVLVGVPSGLHRGLVVALDLAGVGVERDASGGHGDLQAPFAAAGLGQLVSSAHSVHVLLRRSEES